MVRRWFRIYDVIMVLHVIDKTRVYSEEIYGESGEVTKKKYSLKKGNSLQAVKYNWYKRKCHTLYALRIPLKDPLHHSPLSFIPESDRPLPQKVYTNKTVILGETLI